MLLIRSLGPSRRKKAGKSFRSRRLASNNARFSTVRAFASIRITEPRQPRSRPEFRSPLLNRAFPGVETPRRNSCRPINKIVPERRSLQIFLRNLSEKTRLTGFAGKNRLCRGGFFHKSKPTARRRGTQAVTSWKFSFSILSTGSFGALFKPILSAVFLSESEMTEPLNAAHAHLQSIGFDRKP